MRGIDKENDVNVIHGAYPFDGRRRKTIHSPCSLSDSAIRAFHTHDNFSLPSILVIEQNSMLCDELDSSSGSSFIS